MLSTTYYVLPPVYSKHNMNSQRDACGGSTEVCLPAGHWGTRAICCYEKVEQIGEGTYGQVGTSTFPAVYSIVYCRESSMWLLVRVRVKLNRQPYYLVAGP